MKRMSDQLNTSDCAADSSKSSPPAEKIAKEGDAENKAGPSVITGGEEKSDVAGANGSPPSNVVDEKSVDICNSVTAHCDEQLSTSNDASVSASNMEKITFMLNFGKEKYTVTESLDETVSDFKEKVAQLTSVPPSMQKLMFKGMLKDGQTLREAKLTDGCKVMLIGSTLTQIASVSTAPKPEELRQAEAQATVKEPLCKQKLHAKVLEKGIPDDVMPGIKYIRDSLPSAPISGMVNKLGNKVRLTFKLEMDQVWLGTKERTDKIMMSQIKDVVSEPIEGHEEYHIMGLQLGPTEASRYWLYWVPAQYVVAIKEAILG